MSERGNERPGLKKRKTERGIEMVLVQAELQPSSGRLFAHTARYYMNSFSSVQSGRAEII